MKPISAIYVGYAISTGEWHVGLAFCALYTFTYRATWCVFPFTLVRSIFPLLVQSVGFVQYLKMKHFFKDCPGWAKVVAQQQSTCLWSKTLELVDSILA